MKKLFTLLSLIFLAACSVGIKREDYHVFGFDDYTIAVGYDDVEFMKLVFDLKVKDKLAPEEKLTDVQVTFWDGFFGLVDIENARKREIDSAEARITRLVFYLANEPNRVYKLDGIELDRSVKKNCETFNGEYIERNGYACAFGKNVHGRDSIVILYGDILGIDQDELSHLEIYVK